jgi:hypothetical protein
VFEDNARDHRNSSLNTSIGEDRAQKRHYMIPPFFKSGEW